MRRFIELSALSAMCWMRNNFCRRRNGRRLESRIMPRQIREPTFLTTPRPALTSSRPTSVRLYRAMKPHFLRELQQLRSPATGPAALPLELPSVRLMKGLFAPGRLIPIAAVSFCRGRTETEQHDFRRITAGGMMVDRRLRNRDSLADMERPMFDVSAKERSAARSHAAADSPAQNRSLSCEPRSEGNVFRDRSQCRDSAANNAALFRLSQSAFEHVLKSKSRLLNQGWK